MFGKDLMRLKGLRCGVTGMFYQVLKKRERAGDLVVVMIDEYLTSQYFGPAGTKESTMNKHAFLKDLTETLDITKNNAQHQRTDRQQAANNDISIPVEQISVKNQPYSTKKRLFKNERKLRQKYLRKAEQANDDDSRAKF
ncbi:MAG: hypothetical protein EXX96DRAFT_538954 [Benjaminiella poitrasii]|nr:MAG: hypothetical protein EXX96DRAFT_538954 [Benjaminiella poitrasii]